jgi:uncharacterized SAM-binding protein YcdF (DUF218 family)
VKKLILKRKRILVWSSILVGLPLLWCIGVSISIARAGSPNPSATGDVAIVLGAAVWDEEPSPVFQARIDHALELYRRGQVKRLLCTGGMGEGDALSEGEAARLYAIRKGVPDNVILVESQSMSTTENLSSARRMMDEAGLRTAVIVSDPYHLLRAGMFAQRQGLEHVCSPTGTTRYVGFAAKLEQLSRETYYVTRLIVTGS